MKLALRYLVFVAALAAAPLVFGYVPFFTMATAVQIGIMAIGAVGLILVSGYARQVSIGQAAFFAIGAYAAAVLTTGPAVPPALAAVAGMALSGATALVVGLFVFRVRGHYLALATLAFGLVVYYLVQQLGFTGGPTGIPDIPKLAVGGLVLGGDRAYYWLVAGVLLAAVAIADAVVRSPLGRSLRALGDSEVAAAACGVDVRRHKVIAFVLAAVFASVAGSLYAHWVTFVDPSVASLLLSLQFLIMAAVGGMRSVWGGPVGAFTIVALTQTVRELLPRFAPNVGGEFEIAVYGIALVLVLLLLPDGLVGGVRRAVPRTSR